MKLDVYLKQHRRSQAEFAAALRPPVSQALVSQWVLGKTAVSLHYSLEIGRETSGEVTPQDCVSMLQRKGCGRGKKQGRAHA